jgi:hypothetical protein
MPKPWPKGLEGRGREGKSLLELALGPRPGIGALLGGRAQGLEAVPEGDGAIPEAGLGSPRCTLEAS